jgi:glycerophosphoryl diester phosphodiesterase
VFGHRGSPRRFPENTIASFEEALRAGADGFETDLRLLSDKTAVLYHDDDFEEDEFESLSAVALAERGAMIQRLSDLGRFAERTTMILEVKRSKWEDTLLEHISEWPQVVVASFDHSTIAELARRGVAFPLGITVAGTIVGVADYATRMGATWFFPNFRYVEPQMVDELHAKGIRVIPWTANRERDWQRLREIGCDGVITDFPEEAVRWRDKG